MLTPLYGFLRGDTVGLLVLVHDTDSVAMIVDKIQQAASVRVAPRQGMAVWHEGRRLDPSLTVARAGLTALERVDVVPADAAPADAEGGA